MRVAAVRSLYSRHDHCTPPIRRVSYTIAGRGKRIMFGGCGGVWSTSSTKSRTRQHTHTPRSLLANTQDRVLSDEELEGCADCVTTIPTLVTTRMMTHHKPPQTIRFDEDGLGFSPTRVSVLTSTTIWPGHTGILPPPQAPNTNAIPPSPSSHPAPHNTKQIILLLLLLPIDRHERWAMNEEEE